MPQETTMLTCDEAAEYLRLHPRTVCRLLQQGKLPGVKIGRQWRIVRADLDAHLRGQGGGFAPEVVGARMDPDSASA